MADLARPHKSGTIPTVSDLTVIGKQQLRQVITNDPEDGACYLTDSTTKSDIMLKGMSTTAPIAICYYYQACAQTPATSYDSNQLHYHGLLRF